MARYTAVAHASGTLSSVSGTTFTAQASTFDSGDVGRCIMMTSGSAQFQIRKIVGYTSATVVTVDYDWDVSPLANFTNNQTGSAFAEVAPSNNDTFTVSLSMDDLATATANITKTDNNYFYQTDGISTDSGYDDGVQIPSNVLLYDNSITLLMNSEHWYLEDDGAVRFGDINQSGDTSRGCRIIDVHDNVFNRRGWSNTTSSSTPTGSFHFYGGTIQASETVGGGINSPLWIFNTPTDQIRRFIDVKINGEFSCRINGDESVVLRVTGAEGDEGYYNYFHPIELGLFEGYEATSGARQALYFRSADAALSVVNKIRVQDLDNSIVLLAATGNGDMEIHDHLVSEFEAAPAVTSQTATTSSQTQIRTYNGLTTNVLDPENNVITDSYKRIVWSYDGVTVQDDTTVTDGAWDKELIQHAEFSANAPNNSEADYDSENSEKCTLFGVYRQGIIAYEREPSVLLEDARATVTRVFTGFSDAALSESNKTTVDAYTALDTGSKIYDRCKSWSFDNFDDAYPSFGEKLVNASGSVLDFGTHKVRINGSITPALDVDTTATYRDTVTALDSWSANTSLTLSAGEARCVLLVTSYEHTEACTVTSVTYGGVGMALISQAHRRDGLRGCSLWIMLEPDIASKSGDAFVITYDVSPTDSDYARASYEYVDQQRPIYNTVNQSFRTERDLTRDVSSKDEGIAGCVAVRNGATNPTLNSGTTSQVNTTGSAYRMAVGTRAVETVDGSETVGTTNSISNLIAFFLNPRTGRISLDCGATLTADQYDTIKTTHIVEIDDATVVNGWTFDGDVRIKATKDLTNVTVTGDLFIETGTNDTVSYTGVTVTGDVFNDSASNTLTINATNSSLTAGDPGTGNGETSIVNTVNVTFNNVVVGSNIYLEATAAPLGAGTEMQKVTTVADPHVYAHNYTSNQPFRYTIANRDGPLYKQERGTGVIEATGFSINIEQEID